MLPVFLETIIQQMFRTKKNDYGTTMSINLSHSARTGVQRSYGNDNVDYFVFSIIIFNSHTFISIS
jgi:hypothetical protein